MQEEHKKRGKFERVMVHLRVRPFNEDDVTRSGRDSSIESIEPAKGIIVIKKDFDKKTFNFDSAFDYNTSQDQVYDKVAKPVVDSVLQGYNGTIFAYGQTGTGKTHTMMGGQGDYRGITPRAIQQIFSHIQDDTVHTYTVQVGFLQLYMEMLQDLLFPDNEKQIRIREDPEEGVYLSGISWVTVGSVRECMELMHVGDRNRNTAFTSMNSTSSRSHAVYMLKLEKRVKMTAEELEFLEKEGDNADNSMTKSTLYLVDLAGSERVKKSKAVGSRLDEAKNINLALLALGNCIQALADKKAKYVPFRDSKLTRLLEDSLGGNSKTSLIVTIGPSVSHLQESLSSLSFGTRAMKVENRPEINKKVDYKALCAQLQAELDKINDGNSLWYLEKEKLTTDNAALREKNETLTNEKETLEKFFEDFKKSGGSPTALLEFEEAKKIEIQKINAYYQVRIDKKDEDQRIFMEEIDKLMLEQEQDMNQTKNEIMEVRTKYKELKRELRRSQAEAEQERNDRLIRTGQLATELDDVKNRLNIEKEKVAQIQSNMSNLQEQFKIKEKQLHETRDELNFSKAQHQEEIETLEKELQRAINNTQKLKEQTVQKSEEIKTNSEKEVLILKTQSSDKEADYELQIKQLRHEIDVLKDEKEALLKARTNIISKLETATKRINNLDEEKSQINNDLETKTKDHIRLEGENKSKEFEIRDVKRRMSEVISDNEILKLELDTIKAEKEDLQMELKMNLIQLENKERENLFGQLQIDNITRELKSAHEDNAQLIIDKDTFLRQLEETGENNKKLANKKSVLAERFKEERDKLEKKDSELSQLSEIYRHLKVEYESLLRENKNINDQKTNIDQRFIKINEEIKDKESLINNLKKDIRIRSKIVQNIKYDLNTAFKQMEIFFETLHNKTCEILVGKNQQILRIGNKVTIFKEMSENKLKNEINKLRRDLSKDVEKANFEKEEFAKAMEDKHVNDTKELQNYYENRIKKEKVNVNKQIEDMNDEHKSILDKKEGDFKAELEKITREKNQEIITKDQQIKSLLDSENKQSANFSIQNQKLISDLDSKNEIERNNLKEKYFGDISALTLKFEKEKKDLEVQHQKNLEIMIDSKDKEIERLNVSKSQLIKDFDEKIKRSPSSEDIIKKHRFEIAALTSQMEARLKEKDLQITEIITKGKEYELSPSMLIERGGSLPITSGEIQSYHISSDIDDILKENEYLKKELKDANESLLASKSALRKVEMQMFSLKEESRTQGEFKGKTVRKIEDKLTEDYHSVAIQVMDNLKLTLELNEAKSELFQYQSAFKEIPSKVTDGDYQLIPWLKYFLKNHKQPQGGSFFDFLSSLVTIYCKIVERMQIDRQDNIQIFHLSKVVHDKFLQQARQHASKNPHLSKQFDKPLLDLEKEFGIDRNKIPKGAVSKTILQTQQENTNKNPKETEKEIKMAVVNTLDHILMILEIQENIEISYQDLKNKTSPMKISPVKGINRSLDMAFLRLNERINPCLLPIGKIVKESLKNRSSEVDSFVPISQLKQFEVAGLNQALSHNGPSNIDSSKLSQFVKNVKNLKDLCLHLTSLLTITSAIYSSVLFKSINQEWNLDDRGELIQTLISTLARKEFENEEQRYAKKVAERELRNLNIHFQQYKEKHEGFVQLFDAKDAAVRIIQRFWRGKKKREMKKKAFIAEYKYQRVEEQSKSLSQMLSQVNSQTGLFLIRNHYKEVLSIFSGVSKRFTKPQSDLNKF